MLQFDWFYIFVAVHGMMLLALSLSISLLRIKYQVSYGDGGNTALRKAIRIHGNGVEQVPVFGLLILALVLNDSPEYWLAGLVVLFTAARLSHGVGMLRKQRLFRQTGALGTYVCQGAAVVLLVWQLI